MRVVNPLNEPSRALKFRNQTCGSGKTTPGTDVDNRPEPGTPARTSSPPAASRTKTTQKHPSSHSFARLTASRTAERTGNIREKMLYSDPAIFFQAGGRFSRRGTILIRRGIKPCLNLKVCRGLVGVAALRKILRGSRFEAARVRTCVSNDILPDSLGQK